MADKTANLVELFSTVAAGQGERVVLYGCKDIDTNDTVELGTTGSDDFSKIKSAHAQIAGDGATLADDPAIATTQLTFDASGWTNEYVYLTVVGNTS